MTSKLRLAFASVCCVALVGCKPIREVINNTLNAGTVEGVSQCIEMSAREILSEETIKINCIARFNKDVSPSTAQNVTGNAGPRSQSGSDFFSGTMTNKTEGHVITEVVVVVEFRKVGETEGKRFQAVISGWFEPNGNPVDFRSKDVEDAPAAWDVSKYCEDEAGDDCWGWYIQSVKGLKL
ncbi:hypothetical protein [Sulfitobacter sp.]|uniref:hypothetical protein n=1 Tax=Sulfitobacter sp. TaxID=1903071 RepID=UPI003566C854